MNTKYTALSRIGGGTAEFNQYIKPEPGRAAYVAYASKSPVTGRLVATNKKVSTVEEYIENYGNLLMCVAVRDWAQTPLVQHRGIFRDPMSFLDSSGKYSNLSLLLHAFAGKIALTNFAGKSYMTVAPMQDMADILSKILHLA